VKKLDSSIRGPKTTYIIGLSGKKEDSIDAGHHVGRPADEVGLSIDDRVLGLVFFLSSIRRQRRSRVLADGS
jgi:hypothetical protein